MEVSAYQPTEHDFLPADKAALGGAGVQQLTRPSLSYWQDAWIRLRKNRRALFSLWIVAGLLGFTVAGPWVWRVDPATQDLNSVSQGPSFGAQAIVVHDSGEWVGELSSDVPAEPTEEIVELAAPAKLELAAPATTLSVKLRWAPVEGAAGYVIYRNENKPQGSETLGLPLAEVDGGNHVFYEDRLNLETRTYHYSVVATNGFDEADAYVSIEVPVRRAIPLDDAHGINPDAKEGDVITLATHPLGTDALGRDMLARLMHGARVSLFIGIVAPLFFILLGTLYGGVAGYMGGRVDSVLMRFADFVVALPFLLFMILFSIAFGAGPGESGIFPMLVALVTLSWPGTSRLVRGQILQLREEGFVQAARLLGARPPYLVLRHMIPNTLGVILVTLTFAIPSAIFTEAFLSFIGMGVAPPTPSWGSMCNEGIKTMLSHPHELFFPASLISITVLAFNLLGDGLRDALDARMRSRE